MKITFLVGNGFDVSLGLKTSYSDFYHWYCNIPSDVLHIQQFKECINDELDSNIPEEQRTWADLEIGLGKYSTHFSPQNVTNYIECFADAQKQIANYIDEQNSKYDTSHLSPQDIENFKKSICRFYDLSDAENNVIERLTRPHTQEISFISFNYSNILDRIISQLETEILATWQSSGGSLSCRINKNIIHINGALSENPILGVDNTSQIENAQLRTNTLVQQILVKNRSHKFRGTHL